MCNHFEAPSLAIRLPSGRRLILPQLQSSHVYPRRPAPVIRMEAGTPHVDTMPWGIPLPQTGKTPKPVTNIRNLSSPFWRATLASAEHRCLVPAQRFSEWTGPKGSMHEVWFEMVDQSPMMFAGAWRAADHAPHFAFLTCEPNERVKPIHPKAMPVILHAEDYDRWLAGEPAGAFQHPFPSQLMRLISPASTAGTGG